MKLVISKIIWHWKMMIEYIWSIGEMILTGKNQSTQRKTCPTATLSPTNTTCPGLGLAPSPVVTGQQLTA